MKVAVTSQNFRTITGHAGKTRRFLLYEVGPDGKVSDAGRLDLPKEMSLHEHHGAGPHPLDQAEVLITGGCGHGLAQRLAGRGIRVVVTGETDPRSAVTKLAAGDTLAPALSGEHGDHHHEHQHEHGCDCAGAESTE